MEKKCQIDVFCGKLSMDASPKHNKAFVYTDLAFYLSLYRLYLPCLIKSNLFCEV